MKPLVVILGCALFWACQRDEIGAPSPANAVSDMDAVGAGGDQETVDAMMSFDVMPTFDAMVFPDACVPRAERCDGLDNDCNGVIDNDVTDEGLQCQIGQGECRRVGEERCINGGLVCNALEVEPGVEVCDGMDNDCDGIVDNMPEPRPQCEGGVGSCQQSGEMDCVDGELVCNAVPSEPSAEACDGLDNNCDGVIDESFGLGDACTAGIGECSRIGLTVCSPEGETMCAAEVGEPVLETCNGLDDDCDGVEDNPETGICCSGEEDPPCNGCPGGIFVPEGWVCIPPGEARLDAGNAGMEGEEDDFRDVTFTQPMLMMTTEVTQGQWSDVFGNAPAFNYNRDFVCPGCVCHDCPVEHVNWFEAAAYANALSRAAELPECYTFENCMAAPGEGARAISGGYRCAGAPGFAGVDCLGYRLPTEAEWEYAARAGSLSTYWSGDDEENLARTGWFSGNSGQPGNPGLLATRVVGQLVANSWGLFDVHGNVSEWVHDWIGNYALAGLVDPVGIAGSGVRVIRGGSFAEGAEACELGARDSRGPADLRYWVGFRVARTVVP